MAKNVRDRFLKRGQVARSIVGNPTQGETPPLGSGTTRVKEGARTTSVGGFASGVIRLPFPSSLNPSLDGRFHQCVAKTGDAEDPHLHFSRTPSAATPDRQKRADAAIDMLKSLTSKAFVSPENFTAEVSAPLAALIDAIGFICPGRTVDGLRRIAVEPAVLRTAIGIEDAVAATKDAGGLVTHVPQNEIPPGLAPTMTASIASITSAKEQLLFLLTADDGMNRPNLDTLVEAGDLVIQFVDLQRPHRRTGAEESNKLALPGRAELFDAGDLDPIIR